MKPGELELGRADLLVEGGGGRGTRGRHRRCEMVFDASPNGMAWRERTQGSRLCSMEELLKPIGWR